MREGVTKNAGIKSANVRAYSTKEGVKRMKDHQGAQEPRLIKNRDIPLLSRVLYIMQEVCSLEKRIVWQHDRLYGITAHVTGMPSGKGTPSGLDAAFAAISELSDEYREKVQSYIRELKNAERILNAIPSLTMRAFVIMLYVDGMSAEQVKRELNLTDWNFRRARDSIEQAEDMQSVKWREKYIIQGSRN